MIKKLLLTPGPIELTPAVRQSLVANSIGHLSPTFTTTFQNALNNTKRLFKTTNGQPIIISGSGTLGWDLFGSNVVNRNDSILLISTGFFSDSFASCLTGYGAKVDKLDAIPGHIVPLKTIQEKLQKNNYKAVVMTQVDTSTAVLNDVQGISQLVKEFSPNSFVVVDGVCSIGCEVFEFDNWNIDYCLTASQKAIGAPPGLSISMVSPRLLKYVMNERDTTDQVTSFYLSFKKWLPIMESCIQGKPSYFATPPVQLILSLDVALKELLDATPRGLDERIEKSSKTSDWFKQQLTKELGLKMIPQDPQYTAHGLTTIYVENPADLIKFLADNGVFIAGPMLKSIPPYARVGHMGVSAWDNDNNQHITRCYELLREYCTTKSKV
ncbi:hypothetical protein TBLA_0G03410 [Henningerozyma blattae CBS 6284]|uniref:alanine--glyoxylate transaminase n=1 Tax=Henningerozyma blattae (strain ATCC 34711 / CBS 6284 / DSM 70876 / NBRC 10599 / NRRL Y-10934 / UCD 77-7) TaxID=1071380 RepID=I2H7C6_HENB6|nr:hypothetical protein TBLA_0G03410 [Tetrapisispora blattae CBS 6284]CCH62278.1 hypothetical protein TBLA_0G03410 [Tetrapisispora blattae CBS 6284]